MFELFIVVYFQALRNVILYTILAPYDNEQHDLLHRIKDDQNLDEVPHYRYVSWLFVNM